ncbi:MAG: GHKL domain-containing protein, partial [Longicatena sp.]
VVSVFPIIMLFILTAVNFRVDIKQAIAGTLLPFVLTAITNTGVLITASWITKMDLETINASTNFLQALAIFCISKTLLIICMGAVINRHRHRKVSVWFSQGNGYFILPLLSILITVSLLSVFMETPVDGSTYIVAGIIIVALIFLNVIFYYYMRKFFEEQQANQKLQFNQEKYALQVETSREINGHIQEIRMFRHEYKRILMVINQYVKNDQKEEIAKLIQENLEDLEYIPAMIQTNNSILNFVINHKLAEASKQHIDCKMIVQTALLYIQDTDLASLFGNLLDNAIEAASDTEDKYLEISITQKKQMDIILIKNSIQESVIEVIEKMQTTKPDKEIHGIGLKKIKEVVERYGGEIYYFEEGNQLIAQIAFHRSDEEDTNVVNSGI